MVSFVDQRVDSYKQLAGPDTKPLQKVTTPFLDESTAWAPPEGEPTGVLRNVALKILVKILYVARMARPDIEQRVCWPDEWRNGVMTAIVGCIDSCRISRRPEKRNSTHTLAMTSCLAD